MKVKFCGIKTTILTKKKKKEKKEEKDSFAGWRSARGNPRKRHRNLPTSASFREVLRPNDAAPLPAERCRRWLSPRSGAAWHRRRVPPEPLPGRTSGLRHTANPDIPFPSPPLLLLSLGLPRRGWW